MDDDPHLESDGLRILISNRQERLVYEEGLRALARDTMRGEGIERAELSVSFVEQDEIAGLHERFMDEPGPTDVLSFPLDDIDEDGVRLLLVHGILHLLGYDHEDDGARTRMWERQERYSGVRAP